MNIFIRALDNSIVRLGAVSELYVANGYVPVEEGGDGKTIQPIIFADKKALGAAGFGGNAQRLMEDLVTTLANSKEGGLWAIKDGRVRRL